MIFSCSTFFVFRCVKSTAYFNSLILPFVCFKTYNVSILHYFSYLNLYFVGCKHAGDGKQTGFGLYKNLKPSLRFQKLNLSS